MLLTDSRLCATYRGINDVNVSVFQGYHLETSFTDHSHTGCVKAVAISKRGILASGSSDETIKLFNLRKRREIGTLMHHKGENIFYHVEIHVTWLFNSACCDFLLLENSWF